MAFFQYTYDELSLKEQLLYRKIRDGIKRHDEYFICGEKEFSKEEYYEVLHRIAAENPDLFYFHPEKLSFEDTSWGVTKIYPEYFYDLSAIKEIASEIERRKDEFLTAFVYKDMDSGEVIKAVHDGLIKETALNDFSSYRQVGAYSIIGPLLEHRANNYGLAVTFNYLLAEMNVHSVLISDQTSQTFSIETSKVWNLVKIYGEERHIDLYEDAIRSASGKIAYDYFGLNADAMFHNHERLMETENERRIGISQYNNSKTLAPIPLENSECHSVVEGIQTLEKIPSYYLPDDLDKTIRNQISLLSSVEDMKIQYPDVQEIFDVFIMTYLPKETELLREYCRYKKYNAGPIITEVLHEKIMTIMGVFSQELGKRIEAYWKERAAETLQDIGGVQQSLEQERHHRKNFPYDLDELELHPDITTYMKIFDFLLSYDLPHRICKYLYLISDGLEKLKTLISQYPDKKHEVYTFLSFRIPESIRYILEYDEYREANLKEDKLQEVEQELSRALKGVTEAIDQKKETIYEFKAMKTKAGARSLLEVLMQDGFTKR